MSRPRFLRCAPAAAVLAALLGLFVVAGPGPDAGSDRPAGHPAGSSLEVAPGGATVTGAPLPVRIEPLAGRGRPAAVAGPPAALLAAALVVTALLRAAPGRPAVGRRGRGAVLRGPPALLPPA